MNISALTNFNELKIREGIERFFVWWGTELRALVPRSVENWMGDDSAHVIVRIDRNQAQVMLCAEGREQVLGDCDLARDAEPDFDHLRNIVAQSVPEGARVEIELSARQVLSSEVFLPLATEPTLNEVIRFEMDRFTPFAAEQIGYTCRILERIPERDKLKVELNVVRRDYLTDLLDQLSQLGLSVSAVYPEHQSDRGSRKSGADPGNPGSATNRTEPRAEPPRLNLLPIDLQPASVPLWDKTSKNLLAVLLLLLGLTIIAPIYWQTKRIAHLEAEIAAISTAAASAGGKQRLLLAHLEGQELLANKKNQQPAKLENIRELTELLPSTTWVSKLVIDDSDISIQGESSKSSDLIGILEQTRRFKNVEFASPVTRSRSSNMERYEIRMQLTALEARANTGVRTSLEAKPRSERK